MGEKDAARVSGDFLRWLNQGDGRPFFAFLNYYDAHDPYFAPPPFDRLDSPAIPCPIVRPAGSC